MLGYDDCVSICKTVSQRLVIARSNCISHNGDNSEDDGEKMVYLCMHPSLLLTVAHWREVFQLEQFCFEKLFW